MGFFTQKATFPYAAYQGVSAAIYGGSGYQLVCHGGESVVNGTMHADTWAYNPVTDTWTQKATGTTPMCSASAGVSPSNTLVVWGGQTYSGSIAIYNTLRTWNPATNTWTSVSISTQYNRRSDGFSATAGLYLFGGDIGTNADQTATAVANWTTGVLTAKAAVPVAGSEWNATPNGQGDLNLAHLWGGGHYGGSEYTNHYLYTVSGNTWTSVYFYNPNTNTFTSVGTTPSPIAIGFGTGVGTTNFGYVGGGFSGNNNNMFTWEFNSDNQPNPPTINAPADGAALDAASPTFFSWTFTDPDAGDTQTAYALRARVGLGAFSWWNAASGVWQATEVFNPSTAGSVTLPAGAFVNGNTYAWSIATKDSLGPVAGPYSPEQTIVFSSSPVVTITAPTAGSVVTGLTTQRAYWTYSQAANDPQATYHVMVLDSGGAAVWDSGEVNSTATSAVLQGLATGQTYTLEVSAATASGNWSTWATVQFTTSADSGLGVAVRTAQTVEYVYRQLTTQVGRPVPDVDADSAVQNSQQPIIRLALGTTDMTPNGTESGGAVPGEIVGGSLDSAVAGAISHTTGTNSFTLQQNWTADSAYNIYLVGVLNNMPFAMAPGQPRYLAGSSNKRQLVFLFRLPHSLAVQAGDSFETDVTVTF